VSNADTTVALALGDTGQRRIKGITVELVTAPAGAVLISIGIRDKNETSKSLEFLTDESFHTVSAGRRVSFYHELGEDIDLSREQPYVRIIDGSGGKYRITVLHHPVPEPPSVQNVRETQEGGAVADHSC